MKLNTFAMLIGTSAMVLTGCESPNGTPNRTATGALTGGAIGAAAGGLIGSASRHDRGANAAAGALIGGAMGAITGGAIGHSMDQEAQARLRQQAPQTYVRLDQGQPLGLADVKALAAANVGDDVLHVCAWCRKINVNDQRVPMEQYFKTELNANTSHGICPECSANVIAQAEKVSVSSHLSTGAGENS